jgi:hypothetical protein
MRNDWLMVEGVRGSTRCLRICAAAVIACAVWLFAVAPGQASPARIAAADGCCTFASGPFEQPRGEVAVFDNPLGASARHNVYSVGSVPGGGKLFFSATILPDGETPVRGTEYLQAGEYPFVCTLHPGMEGSLTVTGDGAPLPRPSIAATIAGQRLATVVRQGSIRLSVKSVTGVQGARATIRVGSMVIAVARSITVSAGRAGSVTATLSGKGRALLRKKRSVAMSVTSSADFGRSSTTRKVLR